MCKFDGIHLWIPSSLKEIECIQYNTVQTSTSTYGFNIITTGHMYAQVYDVHHCMYCSVHALPMRCAYALCCSYQNVYSFYLHNFYTSFFVFMFNVCQCYTTDGLSRPPTRTRFNGHCGSVVAERVFKSTEFKLWCF